VPEPVFTARFLQELAAFEKSASNNDLTNLDQTLAGIVHDPYLPNRVPSFYDPSVPSFLYRSGNLLIHYSIAKRDRVEFLNLFWSKI